MAKQRKNGAPEAPNSVQPVDGIPVEAEAPPADEQPAEAATPAAEVVADAEIDALPSEVLPEPADAPEAAGEDPNLAAADASPGPAAPALPPLFKFSIRNTFTTCDGAVRAHDLEDARDIVRGWLVAGLEVKGPFEG